MLRAVPTLLVVLAAACGRATAEPAPPGQARAPIAVPDPGSSLDLARAVVVSRAQVTRADLAPWFDTNQLRDALARYQRGDNLAAARAFEAFADARPTDPRARPARFMAELARHDAGECAMTAPALESIAHEWLEIADYAWLHAGSCWHRLGDHARALAALGRVASDSVAAERSTELAARSLAASGRPIEAMFRLVFRLQLGDAGRLELWKLLRELVRGAGDPSHAAALDHEIAARFPRQALGKSALASLGAKARFTPAQWLAIGRRHFEAQDHPAALKALEKAATAHAVGTDGHCEALRLLARTFEKMKRPAQAWVKSERALACDGEVRADATFSGGRNRLRAEAFGVAERLLRSHLDEFPGRSTADDAALSLAEALRGQGRLEEAELALWDLVLGWPEGDQVDEAIWALLWPAIDQHQWAEVVDTADRILALVPRERHYAAEGRTRYWRGRALAHLGREAVAEDDWVQVMREYPLSWYAVLAYSRLRASSPLVARELLQGARFGAGPQQPQLEVPARLGSDERFQTAVALARLGLGNRARRELAPVGRSPDPSEAEAWTWSTIEILAMAGAPIEATRLARAEEPGFGAHWPSGGWRRPWELAHPTPYRPLVDRWARENGPIDKWWVYAIMREESGFNPQVESWANAIGLMQIILPTAQMLARGTDIRPTRANLKRPEIAIQLGTRYLARLFEDHPLFPLASAGYNAGGGAVRKWRRELGTLELDEFVERIPYAEARGYAKRVTRSLARYTWLYEGRHLSLPMGPVGAP
jgi:soluble lytic murein transglycosylase